MTDPVTAFVYGVAVAALLVGTHVRAIRFGYQMARRVQNAGGANAVQHFEPFPAMFQRRDEPGTADTEPRSASLGVQFIQR